MMNKKPSRILNEKTTFLGLSVFDLAIMGYALIILHALLAKINLEFLSFGVVGFFIFALIGIRAKSRPKIIRDYFSFLITKKIFYKSKGAS